MSDDEQNDWITALKPRQEQGWYHCGRRIMQLYGLETDYDGLWLGYKAELASCEFATKRTLRDLQTEYGLELTALDMR